MSKSFKRNILLLCDATFRTTKLQMWKNYTIEITTNAKVSKLIIKTVVLMHTTATGADTFFFKKCHFPVKAHNGSARFCNCCYDYGIMKSVQAGWNQLKIS